MSLPSGARLEIFDKLDSTNVEAKRRTEKGETGPLWILAREQTSGYGRRARQWEFGRGNFAATYMFAPDCDKACYGQVSFIAALAVIEALDHYAAPGALVLKWPNDILAGSDKISGILLENIAHQDGRIIICVGIGVNLLWAPINLDYPTSRLADNLRAGASPPAPDELLSRIDTLFDAFHVIWRRDGFAPIREAWLARAKGVGKLVRVRLPDQEYVGTFKDLDIDGALVLKIGDTERRVAAGDIMFPAS